MQYTLNFDDNGQMGGFQIIDYTLGKAKLQENQFYTYGTFKDGFILVSMGGVNYSFWIEDWGTMEIMRDAAEDFAVDGLKVFVIRSGRHEWSKVVLPAIEENVSL